MKNQLLESYENLLLGKKYIQCREEDEGGERLVSLFRHAEDDIALESLSAITPDLTAYLNKPRIINHVVENSSLNKQKVTEEDLYEDNSGTCLTVIVENKLIIAADTRHNSSYTINSRYSTKIFRINNFFLTFTGFQADSEHIYQLLIYYSKSYETYKNMSISSCARLLGMILYSRRFFPLYSYCTLSGYENGKAVIYSYDPVGSYDRVSCNVTGSGRQLIQPLVDSWIDGKNFENFQPMKFEDGIRLIKKAFDSACEKDVKTGDFLEVYGFDGTNVYKEIINLRKD